MCFRPSIAAAVLAAIALSVPLTFEQAASAQEAGDPEEPDDPAEPDDSEPSDSGELADPSELDDVEEPDAGPSQDDASSDGPDGADAGGDSFDDGLGGLDDDTGNDDATEAGEDTHDDDATDAGGESDDDGETGADDGDRSSRDDDSRGDDEGKFAAEESEAERADLDARNGIETDQEGFRYRRGEFVGLDLTESDISRLREKGFDIVSNERLASVGSTLQLLRGPPQLSDSSALDFLNSSGDPGEIGFNHLFDSSAVQTSVARDKAIPDRTACGCDIGLIDTGVAANLALFRHVTLIQHVFNGTTTAPRLHGTAVSHLVAGTHRNPAHPTTIYVADIFSGPRATSGSSHALILALDWLASQGIAVINISLAGPHNPAVAATIAKLTGRGIVVVAAAGNDGPAAPPVFPSAYAGVIAVTAVDEADRVYRYANRGQQVDFAARGVSIRSIDSKGRATNASGTSFASPVIAARLAQELRRPDAATAARVIRKLEVSARDLGAPGRDPIFGVGLIEAGK